MHMETHTYMYGERNRDREGDFKALDIIVVAKPSYRLDEANAHY